MAQNVKTVLGVPIANVKTFCGVPIANCKTIMGVDNTGGGGSPLLTDIVAYWKQDEASGNALDSHASNDLTDVNGVVGGVTGKVATARDFESSSAQYFTIASNADLELGADTAFTWAGWVRIEQDFQSGTDILGKGGQIAAEDLAYSLRINGTFRFEFVVGNGTTSASVADTSVFPTPVDTWFFIVAWHDPSVDKIFIQINDDATPDEAAWSGGTQSESGAFELGRSRGVFGSSWDGYLDEWGFWKRVLTSDERTTLYNSGNGTTYPF
jgi:hypothetical protein